MYLIVIGAEPEGHHLVDWAVNAGWKVTLIESNREKARQVLQEHNIQVLHGSVSADSILSEANVQQADAIAALSSDDAVNLMALTIGKEHGVPQLFGLVREPSHEGLFKKLGVKTLTHPARVVAEHIFDLLKPDH
jgi:trk system potassium uptake protein TrkA